MLSNWHKCRAVVLIVKYLSPQSLRDTTLQMYCTSLEPKRGLGHGVDLSVLTAFKHTLPHAKSLHDIGVRQLSASGVCHSLLNIRCLTRYLRWQWNIRTKSCDIRLQQSYDIFNTTRSNWLHQSHCWSQTPRSGHTQFHAHRIDQNLEMQGLWSRGVFPNVLRTSLCPQYKVFSTHF